MSKGLGQKIAIKFTEDITGDVTGMFPEPFSTGYIRPKGVAGASSSYSSSYYPVKAFDGSTSSQWYTRTTGTQWIEIKLYAPIRSKGFRWYIGSSYRPNEFLVQGSTDGATWFDIYTGTSDNTTGWKEFTWDLTEAFQYYRWNILSRYSTYIYIYEIEILAPTGQERAFAVSGQQYDHINGSLVDTVYQVISVENHSTQDKTILLTLHPQGRFNNVEGALTITYDASLGSLMGRGGLVESFTETFIPVELEPKPNPIVNETLTAKPDAIFLFTKVSYNQRYEEETFMVTPSCTLDFIFVGVVNP